MPGGVRRRRPYPVGKVLQTASCMAVAPAAYDAIVSACPVVCGTVGLTQ